MDSGAKEGEGRPHAGKVLPQILQKPADDVALNSALVRAGRNAAYWRSEEPVESDLGAAEDPGGDEGKTDGGAASEGAASSSSGTPEPNEVVRGIERCGK